MNFKIRKETDADQPEIYDLIKTAFETAKVSDGDEQDFALMREGLARAKALGYKGVFLCGDPNYYHRFGFTLSRLRGIRHDSIPDDYVMDLELQPGSLDGVTGMIAM